MLNLIVAIVLTIVTITYGLLWLWGTLYKRQLRKREEAGGHEWR